jgi:hypothetical protein
VGGRLRLPTLTNCWLSNRKILSAVSEPPHYRTVVLRTAERVWWVAVAVAVASVWLVSITAIVLLIAAILADYQKHTSDPISGQDMLG